MGKKKKIRRIVDSVGHLFATAPDRKKLRKAQAFDEFLGDLRSHHERLVTERDSFEPGSIRRSELEETIALLEGQIRKAERLLERLSEEP